MANMITNQTTKAVRLRNIETEMNLGIDLGTRKSGAAVYG
jgi:hypothetical protein